MQIINAQTSDSLYVALPSSLKSGDWLASNQLERQRILDRETIFLPKAFTEKFNVRASNLEYVAKIASDVHGMQEKLIEAEQKYSMAQQEANNAKLETLILVKDKKKRTIQTYAIVALLGLVLYAFNRKQVNNRRQEKEALTNSLHKIKDEMRQQQAQVNADYLLGIDNLRKNISRNMHDEICSSLAALKFLVNDAKEAITPYNFISILNDIAEETDGVYIQVQEFSHQLNNAISSKEYKVVDFLHTLGSRFGESSRLSFSIKANEQAIQQYFTPVQNNEVYRILKEAISNSMKHSSASKLDIWIDYNEGFFTLRIADNGKGLQASKSKDGLGLASIVQRMDALKGKLNIRSTRNGTELLGYFPAVAV